MGKEGTKGGGQGRRWVRQAWWRPAAAQCQWMAAPAHLQISTRCWSMAAVQTLSPRELGKVRSVRVGSNSFSLTHRLYRGAVGTAIATLLAPAVLSETESAQRLIEGRRMGFYGVGCTARRGQAKVVLILPMWP